MSVNLAFKTIDEADNDPTCQESKNVCELRLVTIQCDMKEISIGNRNQIF